MKNTRVLKHLLAGICLVSGLAAPAQSGGGFDLSWSKIAGGGGTSTGGVYSVSGTAGQHDAGGPLTNGVYSLTGGYWALPIAVQSSNAPTLLIVPAATPGWATISWKPPTPGFVLQVSPTLTSAAWANAPSGTTNPIAVPAVPPANFYRLKQP